MIFVDSSIFLKHFLDGDKKARNILKNYSMNLATCDIVVNEVLYILMKQHIINKYGLNHYDAINQLKVPEKFHEAFKEASIFLKLIDVLDCEILPNVRYDLMVELMEKYTLLPNDAAIVGSCKIHDIKEIATFDSDLKKIDFLKVIELDAVR